MGKKYIEKSPQTFVNQKSDNFLVGSQQKTQDIDLFYEIEPAEVLYVINKVSDLETFQLLDDNDPPQPDKTFLNSCIVRKIMTEPNRPILSERGSNLTQFIARPLDSNLLKLPIKGEILPIIYFLSSDSNTNVNLKISYYMSSINTWNSSHHNSLPNISALDALEEVTSDSVKRPEDGNPFTEGEELPDLGEFFTERSDVKKVQVYEGDVLLEGRFGQHIRLSSSDKILEENSNWWSDGSDETLGKPVTIISNGQSTENTTELEPRDLYKTDINRDPSTIILTENQPTSLDLAYLDLSEDDAILNTLEFDTIVDTQNPTIQMNSGTLILNARDNKLLGFAKAGIGLATTGNMSIDVTNKIESVCTEKVDDIEKSYKIEMGPESEMEVRTAKSQLGQGSKQEPMVLGDALVKVLAEIMDAMELYVYVGGGGTHIAQKGNPGQNAHTAIKARLNQILSKNHKIESVSKT